MAVLLVIHLVWPEKICVKLDRFIFKRTSSLTKGQRQCQSYTSNSSIEQDICSFGNPAIDKEHWIQIYPPLSHFDPLVVRRDYRLGSLSRLILGSTLQDPQIYRCLHQSPIFLLNIFVCTTDIQSLKSQALSSRYQILDSCNG